MGDQFTIGVIGAGAWGTALATHLARFHSRIGLWGRNTGELEQIDAQRENSRYLPGVSLPENLTLCKDLSSLIANSEYLLIVVPSIAFNDMCKTITLNNDHHLRGVIWACKGLDLATGRFLHEIAREQLPAQMPTAALSGPSFAIEVAKGLPTAVTIAAEDLGFARDVAQLFHHGTFRAYTSTDVIGVELGGTFKNILAIAAGITDGLHYGANARAALITRGIAEMLRFGKLFEIQPETLVGLSGIGDIVLSCTDDKSRNRRLGLGLGLGTSIDDIEKEIGQVLEGKFASQAIHQLAHKLEVELPISEQVYQVVCNNKSPKTAVEELLARSSREEFD
jgi:glycerol-3-phosphate dehydrogenase (NAD(P)+)